jgi:hypothetical protein
MLLMSACSSAPPEVCAPGGGPLAFTDVTELVGLEDIDGGRLASADIDGDGRQDLFIHPVASGQREDFDGVRTRWVLLNRPGDDGLPRFEDVTEQSNYLATRDGEGGRAAAFAVFGDVDNDGDLDVFSGAYNNTAEPQNDSGDRNEVLLGDGAGRFQLAPPEASDLPQDLPWTTAGASFTDVNLDGKLDVFVGNFYEVFGRSDPFAEALFVGNGDGTFVDRTERYGIHKPRQGSTEERNASGTTKPAYGVTVCDANDDGWPDLFVASYGRGFNEHYQGGPLPLTEVGLESGVAGDLKTDFSDNEFYRCYCATTGNCQAPAPRIACTTQYWNPGSDDQPHRLNGNTFSIDCADLDNDGDQDLLTGEIKHWHIGESSDASEILFNDGSGRFERIGNEATGLARDWDIDNWNEGDIHVAVADLDNDGRKDILMHSSDYPDTRLFFYHQQPDGSFVEKAQEAGLDFPRAAAMTLGDFDGDGDLDIITTFSTMRCDAECPWERRVLRFFRNDSGDRRNALRIRLEGAEGSNRSAIGARVRVLHEGGGPEQTYEIGGGYGHFGLQHGTDLLIGTDDRCTVEQVGVRWPDRAGTVETWKKVRANYDLRLIQGERRPEYGAGWRSE